MIKTFNELWEKAEQFHKSASKDTISALLDELNLKISLYKTIDLKEIDEKEKIVLKTRTFGEILLTLTNLSLNDNVNTFKALSDALQYRELEFYSKKSY